MTPARKNLWGLLEWDYLQAGCPSCHPTNCAKIPINVALITCYYYRNLNLAHYTIIAYFFVLWISVFFVWGTGIRGLMRGMVTFSQGNQELLVVSDKVRRPSGELGVSKSMECDIFPFSAVTLLVGWQEDHTACKKMDVGLSVLLIWLELCTK